MEENGAAPARACIIVPVKGSSSRVPCKNVKLLSGLPLFIHTLKKLSKLSEKYVIYIDTESDAVWQVAVDHNYPCRRLTRDVAFASNATDGHQLLLNSLNMLPQQFEVVCQVLCTAPFLSVETIDASIAMLLQPAPEYDSVCAGSESRMYLWRDNRPLYDVNNIPNSVDLPATFVEGMCMYAITVAAAQRSRRRIGDRPMFFNVSPMEMVDINYESDFELASCIARGLRLKEATYFELLKHKISSEHFADVMVKLGMRHCVIAGLTASMPVTLMGRCKVLTVRELHSGEDPHGIYDSMTLYDACDHGDIVFVNNRCPSYAFFGGINATLAKSKGVSGAIVFGTTRDVAETAAIGMPVYYKDVSPSDILHHGTVESINQATKVETKYGWAELHPEDLIYADSDGIVVVPKQVESKVMEMVIHLAQSESSIVKAAVFLRHSVEQLIEDHGFF